MSSPLSVIRPIRSLRIAVNHSAPSGPATMPNGALPAGSANDVVSPAVVMRPIRSSPARVNHSAPSGARVISDGRESGASSEYTST